MEEGIQASPTEGNPAAESRGLTDPLLAGAQARVGSTLRDKWRLDVLLGIGGAAAVYAATHRNGSRAAVKILHPEMSTSAFVRDRFLWEGYVANLVGHEGAVRVIDDDVADDGSLFLVTELLDGETLEERRVRLGGQMPENEVLVAADQLLDVLAAAHAQGIVHRDIKPENVFLTRAGKVKVLDFGIARLRELASGNMQAGAMIGTPAYMAPEHAKGLFDEVDELSDIWACGATMFQLLTGRGVHDGSTVHEELTNAMTQAAQPLATVRPEISAAAARVVDRALSFTKDMRWPDMRSMQAAVREAYLESSGSPIASASPLRVDPAVPDRTVPPARAVAGTGWGPTSIRPVAISGDRNRPGWVARSRLRDMLVGGVATLGLTAAGFAWIETRTPKEALVHGGTSGAVQVVSSAAGPDVVEEISPLSSPEVLPEAPRVDEPPKPAPRPPIVWRPLVATKVTVEGTARPPPSLSAAPQSSPSPPSETPPVSESSPPPSESLVAEPTPPSESPPAQSPSGSRAPEGDCQPPFVVDTKTGKKIWNVNCL